MFKIQDSNRKIEIWNLTKTHYYYETADGLCAERQFVEETNNLLYSYIINQAFFPTRIESVLKKIYCFISKWGMDLNNKGIIAEAKMD